MKYSDKIYFCSSLETKQNRILERIKRGDIKSFFFIITIPPKYHQLELFRLVLDKQPTFDIKDHTLVGVAKDYDAGIEIIYKISQEVYAELGTLEYRKFFNE